MDYQRMNLARLQRLEVNRTTQIKALARAARTLLSSPHHNTLADIMAQLNQERTELRYWIRVKSGRITAIHERSTDHAAHTDI